MSNKSVILRAQAAEFQPANSQSPASGTNTAVPTPTATPKPDATAAQKAAEQVAEHITRTNRGSFSTLSPATSAENDVLTPEQPPTPEVEVKLEMTSALVDSALNHNGDHLVDDGENMMAEVGTTKRHSRVHDGYGAGHHGQASGFHHQTNPAPGPAVYNTNYTPYYVYPNTNPYMYQNQSYYNNSPFAGNATPALVNPQGQIILSTGSDPISEGRRVYIGNLKYSVNRAQIKKLLRQFGVNNTVEKIYMPYSDAVFESSAGPGEHAVHDALDSTTRGMTFPTTNSMEQQNSGGAQDEARDGDPPNKGFVFVTYTDPQEADLAIHRLSGAMHLDRRLVCRPGLPKGVAFRQADQGSGPGFYRGGRNNRRNRMFRDDRFQDRDEQQVGAVGGVNYYGTDNTYGGGQPGAYGGGGYVSQGAMGNGYAYGGGYGAGQAGGRHTMDSGYRSGMPAYKHNFYGN